MESKAMNMTNHTESPFFERLPRCARPALQAAWDKAHGRQFGTIAIYQSFCRDMEEIGHDKPSKLLMTEWITRVQGGLVARPGSPADGADPAVVATLAEVLAEPIEEIAEEAAILDAEFIFETAVATVRDRQLDEAPRMVNPYQPQGKGAEERAERRKSVASPVLPADPQPETDVLKLFASPSASPSPVEAALSEVRDSLRKELRITCADGLDDLTDAVVTSAHKLARDMMIEILRDLAAEMGAAA
jgi:hypothetical protein